MFVSCAEQMRRSTSIIRIQTIKKSSVIISLLCRDSGSAGGSKGLPAEGDGGQAEADGDQQRHAEPVALPHAQGES